MVRACAVWGMGMYEKPLDLLPRLAAKLNLLYKYSINLQRFVLLRKALLVAAWPTRSTLMCLEGVHIVCGRVAHCMKIYYWD